MKISRRIADGWVKQDNKDKGYCDECKKQLWINPGNKLYCDTKNCGQDYAYFTKVRELAKNA